MSAPVFDAPNYSVRRLLGEDEAVFRALLTVMGAAFDDDASYCARSTLV